MQQLSNTRIALGIAGFIYAQYLAYSTGYAMGFSVGRKELTRDAIKAIIPLPE